MDSAEVSSEQAQAAPARAAKRAAAPSESSCQAEPGATAGLHKALLEGLRACMGPAAGGAGGGGAAVAEAVRVLQRQQARQMRHKRRCIGSAEPTHAVLEAALQAQARGVRPPPELDAYLAPLAWRTLEGCMRAVHRDWWEEAVAAGPELVAVLSRACDSSHGSGPTAGLPLLAPVGNPAAMAALGAMHDAVFRHADELAASAPKGVGAPAAAFGPGGGFECLLAAAARVANLVPAEERAQAYRRVLCMADAVMAGASGAAQAAAQRSEDSPDIPLNVCIEDVVAIVPTAEDADVFLLIDRNDLLASSFSAVMAVSRESWCECEFIDVSFAGESGYGEGILRDWLTSLAHELFLKTQFFVTCPEAPAVVHPAPACNDQDCAWMNFAGRVLALGIKFGVPLGVHVSGAMLKLMTLRRVGLRDLHEVDPAMARTLRNMAAAASEAEVSAMGLDGFRAPDGSELFPGGGEVQVLHSNCGVYADMVAQHVLAAGSVACMAALDGFMHIVGVDLIHAAFVTLSRMEAPGFNAMVGGDVSGDVCASAWACHTLVQVVLTTPGPHGNTADRAAHEFFEVVSELSPHERRALLHFWTGLRCLPAGGFGSLPNRLRLVLYPTAPPERLPTVHTCVMSLDMPCGGGRDTMRAKLQQAILLSSGFEDDNDDDVLEFD